LDKNSQNVICQKKEQLLANIEVVGEERRRVVEVVGLGQTNQLLPTKKTATLVSLLVENR
jgi:hypothetical protein